MMRFVLAAALASLALPAADDAGDFFALFARTCAKAPKTPARFAEAAKAAGATFRFALSKRPEGDPARAWNDTTYWVADARPHGLTLSMSVHGSAARHGLSCLIYAPPHSGVTLDAAVAHIRAAMGLGEPTATTPGAPDGESGASWSIGSGEDEQRIGASIPAANSDAQASIAVITQGHAP
jgi:hypothetical protein